MAKVDIITEALWGVTLYNKKVFLKEASKLLKLLVDCNDLEDARCELGAYITKSIDAVAKKESSVTSEKLKIAKNCGATLGKIIDPYGEEKTEFSVVSAIFDLAKNVDRPDLSEPFFAEMINLIIGLEGRLSVKFFKEFEINPKFKGRKAAKQLSDNLDLQWKSFERAEASYKHGLIKPVIAMRKKRKNKILNALGGTLDDWNDWNWHIRHIVKDARTINKLVDLPKDMISAIKKTKKHHLPFGVTPFYLSLLDENGKLDAALRAQVFPSLKYVESIISNRKNPDFVPDFIGGASKSPVDLVTRQYLTISSLKPFNTCPQFCVYCTRNWEIDEVKPNKALASEKKILGALDWIAQRPFIKEIVITGGDPLMMDDSRIKWLLDRVVKNKNIERIRIESRTPVSVPMRVTDELAKLLGSYRIPGEREICLITHVQHSYEINPDMVVAVDRIRKEGIGVYNQLVYTFFTSRRFEAAALRKKLRLVGIDSLYTFILNSKEGVEEFNVPMARLLQEQKEETGFLSGLVRTDIPVFDVPKLGKNQLSSHQLREIISILPNGSRVYEWHPLENNVDAQTTYIGKEIPILKYLQRLKNYGAKPEDYGSIWYYF